MERSNQICPWMHETRMFNLSGMRRAQEFYQQQFFFWHHNVLHNFVYIFHKQNEQFYFISADLFVFIMENTKGKVY
jgi:hypothetical protein